MKNLERRYDIDWLRVIAIGLLIIYHISIVFQPWGVFIGFIQSNEPLEGIWPFMQMLNVWRIPLLFAVSGIGVGFAMKRRNIRMLLGERIRRILLPFIFGTLAISPLHVFLWQEYYSQNIHYTLHPGHLWFLGNIMIYVLFLSPIFFYIKSKKENRLVLKIHRFISKPRGLILISVLFLLEYVLVKPDAFEIYALTWHGFFIGMLAFIAGFLFIQAGEKVWITLRKYKWINLTIAFLIYLNRVYFRISIFPGSLVAIESSLWIYAFLGLGYQYLNKSSKILVYLSRAVYPVYILHMVFLFLGSKIILPLAIPVTIKFLSIIGFTVFTSYFLYEMIRRVPFIRMLLGINKNSVIHIVGNDNKAIEHTQLDKNQANVLIKSLN